MPEPLAASVRKHFGAQGHAWLAALSGVVADCFDRWGLRLDGSPIHGTCALVIPVVRTDGTPAVLRLQPLDEDSADQPVALRTWDGDGAVRLLEAGADAGTMLLERLDMDRPLSIVADDLAALQILAELLARLCAVPAPEGLRRLSDIAAAMLDRVPESLPRLTDPAERRFTQRCAAMVGEVLPEAGDRLLHWDLHYDNVVASLPRSGREPWLAIDPAPLAGDPCFELLPAIGNRWDEMVATGNLTGAIRRRFDLMTDVVDLDRQRARAWTAGRVLQNILWDIEAGETKLHPDLITISQALLTNH